MNPDGEGDRKPKMFIKRDLTNVPRSPFIIGNHRLTTIPTEPTTTTITTPQQQQQTSLSTSASTPLLPTVSTTTTLSSSSSSERPISQPPITDTTTTSRITFVNSPSPIARSPDNGRVGSAMMQKAIEPMDIWLYLKENPVKLHEIPAGLSPSEAQKIKIVNEIISTERDYVRDLAFVSVYYIMPLKLEAHGLKPNERDMMFKNWDPILLINFEIMSKFEKIPIEEISKVFLSYAVFLKCYNSFCSTQSTRSRLVKETVTKSDEFKSFVDSVRALPDSRQLDLESFLMKPIQRICKYPLLLRELSKCTLNPQESQEIEQAMEKIQFIADGVNRSTQTADNQTHMREIDKALSFKNKKGEPRPILVVPSRVFVSEGPAFDCQRKEEVHLILFNDLLIITQTSRKQTYKVLDWIDLGSYLSEVKLECIAECSYMPMVSIFTDMSRFCFRDTSEVGWASLIPQYVPIRESIAGKPWFCEESEVQTKGRMLEPGEFFITYSAAHITAYDLFINCNKTIKRMVVSRENGSFVCKGMDGYNKFTTCKY